MCVFNDSNRCIFVDKGTLIASVKPVLPTDTLFLIDENDMDYIDIDSHSTETRSVNLVGKKKSKKPPKKPVFSRPVQNDPN